MTRGSLRAMPGLIAVGVLAILGIPGIGSPDVAGSEAEGEPKSNRLVCGSCPEGYATTGTSSAQSICKDGDPTLVQCVPLGGRLLAVCGTCPEGYSTIGTSMVPSRCGSDNSGLMSQCQLNEETTE